MLSYYLRLALKSLRRTPGLTALMVGAIALGIAACIVTLTVYHTMSGNPIWWKNNVLYAVTMDSWGADHPWDSQHPMQPPPQLTYTDATSLLRSDIPKRQEISALLVGMLSGVAGRTEPLHVVTRATTADFFAMFDVPFEYGGPWRGGDLEALPEIVLTQEVNDALFGGIDSVGRSVTWNGNRFRVAGVLRKWGPEPRYYDLTDGAFVAPQDADQVFVPFSWVTALRAYPMGDTDCHGSEHIQGYQQFLTSNCVWIQMWVELPTAARRASFQAYVNAYWAAQRRAGRFPRPLNNHLSTVSQWLRINGVVTGDTRILLRVAFAFLAVCLINTIGILLTKFLRGAPIVGVRRALGANRRQIFLQHIVEVAVVSISGALLGLALGAAGLAGVHALGAANSYGMLAHFDPLGVAWALALAALSTLAAGLYPAWSVGRLPPAVYLKGR